jgi:hypothetical protein
MNFHRFPEISDFCHSFLLDDIAYGFFGMNRLPIFYQIAYPILDFPHCRFNKREPWCPLHDGMHHSQAGSKAYCFVEEILISKNFKKMQTRML